jgi:antitoxin HicB
MDNPHIGSSFDDFLEEEGLYEDARTAAVERVVAWQGAGMMRVEVIIKTGQPKVKRTQ